MTDKEDAEVTKKMTESALLYNAVCVIGAIVIFIVCESGWKLLGFIPFFFMASIKSSWGEDKEKKNGPSN